MAMITVEDLPQHPFHFHFRSPYQCASLVCLRTSCTGSSDVPWAEKFSRRANINNCHPVEASDGIASNAGSDLSLRPDIEHPRSKKLDNRSMDIVTALMGGWTGGANDRLMIGHHSDVDRQKENSQPDVPGPSELQPALPKAQDSKMAQGSNHLRKESFAVDAATSDQPGAPGAPQQTSSSTSTNATEIALQEEQLEIHMRGKELLRAGRGPKTAITVSQAGASKNAKPETKETSPSQVVTTRSSPMKDKDQVLATQHVIYSTNKDDDASPTPLQSLEKGSQVPALKDETIAGNPKDKEHGKGKAKAVLRDVDDDGQGAASSMQEVLSPHATETSELKNKGVREDISRRSKDDRTGKGKQLHDSQGPADRHDGPSHHDTKGGKKDDEKQKKHGTITNKKSGHRTR